MTQQLDDHIVMLQSMGFSPYKKPFEDRLAKWDIALNLVSTAWPAAGLPFPHIPYWLTTCGGSTTLLSSLMEPMLLHSIMPIWAACRVQVSEVLDQWITLQRTWMYLEPIFSSDDIMQQLPLEGKRFATVDRAWRKTMDASKRAPAVLKVCRGCCSYKAYSEGGGLQA